jgi:hypothetical protein
MISSDQWANKRVRISMGPFQGYVGNVEKWSNGWVGVRIPDVGLHNRRSFELYLDEDIAQVPNRAPSVQSVPRDTVTPSPHIRTPSPKDTAAGGGDVGLLHHHHYHHQPITPNPTMDEGDPSHASKKSTKLLSSSLPQVTPTETRAAVTCLDSTKIQSLLSSQEADTSRLDLLFGTAALERSRRNIRPPMTYQDTGMLNKKLKHNVSL